jgi:hypothetical protein
LTGAAVAVRTAVSHIMGADGVIIAANGIGLTLLGVIEYLTLRNEHDS